MKRRKQNERELMMADIPPRDNHGRLDFSLLYERLVSFLDMIPSNTTMVFG